MDATLRFQFKTGSGKQFGNLRAGQGNDRARQVIALKQPISKSGFHVDRFLKVYSFAGFAFSS